MIKKEVSADFGVFTYSDIKRTVEQEDDIKVILKCIWCVTIKKKNALPVIYISNHLLSEMGLFTFGVLKFIGPFIKS